MMDFFLEVIVAEGAKFSAINVPVIDVNAGVGELVGSPIQPMGHVKSIPLQWIGGQSFSSGHDILFI